MRKTLNGNLQVDTETGAPRVNYRETITKRAEFDYLHKKQSGGQGQYGRVVGYIEPLPEDTSEKFQYENEIVGNAIPPNYLPSCKKGARCLPPCLLCVIVFENASCVFDQQSSSL